EESKLGVLEHILQPRLYPELYGNIFHKVRINYYPPRGDNKEGWDNIDIFGWLGYPMQIKVDFLCRDSILAAPIVLDLVLFLDLAQRTSELKDIGIQEWLSFYFKSPMTAPGLYPEHDLFIQLMKLKNTLRHLRGEELYLFPDGTYIYCEWADIEPLTLRDKGAWKLADGLVVLTSDRDVTWDPDTEPKYVAVRRRSHYHEILLVGIGRDLSYFEENA